jgi:hypothetical protein
MKYSGMETNTFKSESSSHSSDEISDKEDRLVRSIKSEDITKRRWFVLKFPDGTYSHGKYYLRSWGTYKICLAFKNGDTDSWLEAKFYDLPR